MIAAFAAVLAVVAGVLVTRSGGSHLVIAIGLIPLVVAVVWLSPRKCIYGLVVWTVCLGFFRRIVPGGAGLGFGDPLLLVAPAVITLLFVSAAARGAFRTRSPFANSVALLSLIALIEAANPLQGGLKVGLGGLMYILVPLLAFWVGRIFLTKDNLRTIMWLVAILAAFNAGYGLLQTYAGLPSWDARWVHSSGYVALNVVGQIRAFGSFSSSAEYAVFLGLGLVCWIALVRRGGTFRLPICLGAITLIGFALVLESSRGAVVWAVIAVGVMAAARAGRRLGGAVGGAVIAIAVLYFLASQFGATPAAPGSGTLTGHLFNGLANPGQSSLPGHFSRLVHGLTQAFTQPLGHGTGSVTIAAARLGGAQSLGTEVDPGNVGVAFGLLGLVVYLVVLARGLTLSYRVALDQRDAIGLAVVGMVVITSLQWLNGDYYSVSWLIWLLLGWVDATYTWRRFESVAAANKRATNLVTDSSLGNLVPVDRSR